MGKKIFAVLLLAVLVFAMLPAVAAPARAAETTPAIAGIKMTLNGVLNVNLRVQSNGADMSGYYVRFTIGADTKYQTVDKCTKDDSIYVYSAELVAHRMHETLKAELFDGSNALIDTQEFTIAEDYVGLLETMDGYKDNAELMDMLHTIPTPMCGM